MFPARRSSRRTTLAALLIVALYPFAAAAGAGEHVPKGHYLSFARERNLQTEMVDPLAHPDRASDYQLEIARNLESAIETPGVKGLMMFFKWRDVEVADGKYDWRLMDADIAAARRYGRELIIKISDRSYDGSRVLPDYFPSEYVLAAGDNGHTGYVAKRWDPYVYTRVIRLYRAIAERYADDPAFGGIGTTETATGDFSGGDYSADAYVHALSETVSQSEAALTRGKLFFYMNFLKDGQNIDMNKDLRVSLLESVPHDDLVVGGPDITPDMPGMPRSVTAYRIHVRKTMPELPQFCHLQHVDQGARGINVKNNQYRQQYLDDIARIGQQQTQSTFGGAAAALERDDLRDAEGNEVELHPKDELGKLWTPEELFEYGLRNFGCDYFIWHYRENPKPGEFTWSDVRKVITDHPCFYDPDGCGKEGPNAPDLR